MSAATAIHQHQLASTPFVEISQIHQCLRMEVTELAKIVSQARKDTTLRVEALRRFEALKSIYESHSKAEDEIIFPELQARGLSSDACAELDRQHNGQHDTFVRLERVLRCWSDDAVELADELRASIVLHLRMEEEEVLPLLETNLKRQELGYLLGKVIGDRSSELMEAIIGMLCRNLPPDTVQSVIYDFKQAAMGTNFSHWMDQETRQANKPQMLFPDVHLSSQDHNAIVSVCSNGRDPGCAHYRRGLKLWAQCCQKLYPCVRCHDEAVQSSHPINLSENQAWCMTCGAFQSNPSSHCVQCHATFGAYTCTRCEIWESDPEVKVYHCPYCDVCRLGLGLGIDYFHCMRCNACISTKMRFHKCVEGSLERECPVCCETLFSTTKPVQYVPCGHLIHRECFANYLQHDYRCATCRCSMIDMSNTWQKLEELTAASPSATTIAMPSQQLPQSRSKCNDCGMQSVPLQGPIQGFVASGLVSLQVGERCEACGSFNTL